MRGLDKALSSISTGVSELNIVAEAIYYMMKVGSESLTVSEYWQNPRAMQSLEMMLKLEKIA